MAGESSAHMHTKSATTVLLAASLAGAIFRRPAFDALRMPDPDIGGGSNLCGITSDPTARGFLLSPEDGAGGGVQFTPEQQAKVDAIVQKRLADTEKKHGDEKAALTAKLKELETLAGSVKDLETKLAASEVEKQAAAEEAALKGKSDLEKLQHNFDKAQKAIKESEAKFAADMAKLTQERDAERNGRTDDAKLNWVTQALASGAAEGMSPYAIRALLDEGQFEIDDKRQITKVTFEGKTLEKQTDVASEFFKARPGFAKAPPGGAGTPRGGNPGAGGRPDMKNATPEEFFNAGLSSAPVPVPGASGLI